MHQYSLRHKVLRLVWQVTWFILASWTPPQFRIWRVLLLRLFGARIGTKSDVRSRAIIWYPPNLTIGNNSLVGPDAHIYNMDFVHIADSCIISQGAFLCGGTHDIDDPLFALVTKPIVVESDAWVAAEAMVGPGVVVGRGAVLGARAVAFKDLSPWTVYGGNPAKAIRQRKWIATS